MKTDASIQLWRVAARRVVVGAFACAFCFASVACAPGGTVQLAHAKSKQQESTRNAVKPAASGKPLSGSWRYKSVKVNGKKKRVKVSFRYRDGSYPKGITSIGKRSYYFKSKGGKLSTSKKAQRLARSKGKVYAVGPDGTLLTGWHIVGGKLRYFAEDTYASVRSRKVDGIRLLSNGIAQESLNSVLKVKCIRALDKITDRNAPRGKQLRAVWKWLVSKKNFRYGAGVMSPTGTTWSKTEAYKMLTLRKGNCFRYASTFSALAAEIGYNPKVVWGRVYYRAGQRGNRHAMVQIDGKWFDPQAEAVNHIRGIYNTDTFKRKGINNKKSRYFKDFTGGAKLSSYKALAGIVRVPKAVSSKSEKPKSDSGKLVVTKRGNTYYGTKGSKKLSGLYCIKGKLYKFNKSGTMSSSAFAELKAASKAGAKWADLEKLVGKPKKKAAFDSCFGAGKDVIRTYAHVEVSTFRPANGSAETVSGVEARS